MRLPCPINSNAGSSQRLGPVIQSPIAPCAIGEGEGVRSAAVEDNESASHRCPGPATECLRWGYSRGMVSGAVPEYPPTLGDMLKLERVEKRDSAMRFPERQYDDKFGILQSPTLLRQDLHYYRAKCGMRRIPVAIAFVDIDKFKDFNTAVGHIHVDQHVLPVFMRTVETHIYGHGHAYKYGGEEYVLLMPNADANLAMEFVQSLRKRVATLTFHGTERTITISVGLGVADQDCHLTDEELLQKAALAMNFAKNEGRDRVSGYIGKLFDENELKVLGLPSP